LTAGLENIVDFGDGWSDVNLAPGIAAFDEANGRSLRRGADCSKVRYALEAENLHALLETGFGEFEERPRIVDRRTLRGLHRCDEGATPKEMQEFVNNHVKL
jgi:hypothetical protein